MEQVMTVSAESPAFAAATLLLGVDRSRIEASKSLDSARRSELGQFMTPPRVASFMASLFGSFGKDVRLLDAGAGVGSLFAAVASDACSRVERPVTIRTTAFDVEPVLAPYLRQTSHACRRSCSLVGVDFAAEVVEADFIQTAVAEIEGGLFRPARCMAFTHAILNPPYKKLNSNSAARAALKRVGIETSNLYTAFLGLSILLLEPGGELVAITPRSFCNGPYFRPFREMFFREMSLQRLHVFDSRTAAFADDEVLQENVIVHAIKGAVPRNVVISSSSGQEGDVSSSRTVPHDEVVRPNDPESFIHVVPSDAGSHVTRVMERLPLRLADLHLSVSTGKVVDFRAREFLRQDRDEGAFPLVYPTHFADGVVRWPKAGKKPNALVDSPKTADLWMPTGTYVLVKRFSSKEERKRVVAAVFDPERVPGAKIGFENHLNVFHMAGNGLPPGLAVGLATFLNSTLVDTYFRQFNGHTQVNATDLRNLRFPSRKVLEGLAQGGLSNPAKQEELDAIVETRLGFTTKEIA